jgi:hypothetical protein
MKIKLVSYFRDREREKEMERNTDRDKNKETDRDTDMDNFIFFTCQPKKVYTEPVS